jgi:hypothetical protein
MVDPVAVNVEDLVVEFRSGGYAVRPIDGLSLQVAPARTLRMRQDDLAVLPGGNVGPHLGNDPGARR